MKRTRITTLTAGLALTLAAALAARAAAAGEATPQASLKWTDAAVPGVATAQVQGDMAKGPSHFYLRYAAGFVAPISSRFLAIAPSPSSTCTTTGPDVMNSIRAGKKGLCLCSA